MPDIIANLRLDQAWGFVGISAALHDASGAYYATPNVVNNGHPEDKYGWALAGGAKFNLAGRRHGRLQRLLLRRRSRHVHQPTTSSSSTTTATSVGYGWTADGVFNTGTQIELTRVWSALAAYEHIWNPKWRTAVGGGYVNVDYNGDRDQPHQLRDTPGRPGELRRGGSRCDQLAAFTPAVGNSCSPDYQLLGSLHPHPVEPGAAARYRSEVMYHAHNTAYKGAGGVAANGSRPAVVNGVIDDQNVWSAMFRWQRNFYP